MNILLTGATGYIGRRLLTALVQQGHAVICLVRDARRLQLPVTIQDRVTVVEGDLLKPQTLSAIPKDIDAAYYLVHSMSQSATDFQRLEKESAQNFVHRIKQTRCRQIIYLGGITYDAEKSPHLASRLAVENILKECGIPYTTLRAGIIIGSGSASFEIIRDLVEKLPVMIAPKWLNTPHQPIAVRDVIFYLSAVLGNQSCLNKSLDIGGPDILTYKEMLLSMAKVRGLRRLIITVPVLTPRLSSYWLYFVTATSFSLARSLVESMKHEVIARETEIHRIIRHDCLPFVEAVRGAFAHSEDQEIISSWKDAWSSGRLNFASGEFVQAPTHGCLVDHQQVTFSGDPQEVLDRVWRIGGEQGWYYGDFLWELRGFLDKLAGGVGLRRGRRHPTDLREGDALDFWRVLVADRKIRRLLLFAEMKLPGEAWLEFRVETRETGGVLHQTATFRPRGLLGRIYWYAMMPAHLFIFRQMAKNIALTGNSGKLLKQENQNNEFRSS
ncbi:MAG: SDR family oxidoreductase [Calditrichia bacterium]